MTLAINLSAVSNIHHGDNLGRVVDSVNDPVIAKAYPPGIAGGQFLESRWARSSSILDSIP